MILKIIGIVAITTVIVAYFYYESGKKEVEKTYNATVQAWLLTRGDHICDRIGDYTKSVKLHNNLISADDFLKFTHTVENIVRDELAYRTLEQRKKEEENETNLRIYR